MRNSKFLLITSVVCLLTACSSNDDDDISDIEQAPQKSAGKLYNEARSQISVSGYKEAIRLFEEVERQHPYSPLATDAQVMSAYSSYLMGDYDSAIYTLERFVKLSPNNESTPYAYYLIGMCYYEQISDVGRDQKITEQALSALREVVIRFPDSNYARDAKIKLELTLDHLAGKEMQVGLYYLRQNDVLAGINRFRFVVEHFQTTSHVPEALHRLVESYLKLGIIKEAKRYASVLGHNFPSSSWYRDSYKLMGSVGAKPSSKTPPKTSSWLEYITPY